MKPALLARTLLLGTALALTLPACGQAGDPAEDRPTEREDATGEPRDEDDEDTPAAEGEVRVLNLHGDEEGFEDQTPGVYVATASTTFTDMEWDQWDDTRARGEGEVLGTWCMDQGCQDDPYDVEVELGDPVEVDGTWYFSTYSITEYDDDMPQEQRDALAEADDGRLTLPAAPGD
ncbi:MULTISPECIES: hypothetical protein [unclassified Nocardiopsis]|uniref:hypothetical protein n=1 Tax=unclassified Nocardiopsis TaxID=2649073 RepID=UPI0033C7AD92